eukprot:CAMPEP_0113869572 /NCGR_PEP_ID=MMETSP0780_2-20120614/1608_1 /TAXON_ID=652834 /ORGANISM="Palpitomonas bilix" /LENGTH=285 /DNA_ID=CAMNT_0000854759 /DNA_START=16 /DNA_END=873 /DNA_ORIENTATION=- /assembly_acc=CAM_ASM_000599
MMEGESSPQGKLSAVKHNILSIVAERRQGNVSKEVFQTVTNLTEEHIAIKMKTTAPNHYCVRPNLAVLSPKEKFEVEITYCTQSGDVRKESSERVDKFLVESVVLSNEQGVSLKKITEPAEFKENIKTVWASFPKPAIQKCHFETRITFEIATTKNGSITGSSAETTRTALVTEDSDGLKSRTSKENIEEESKIKQEERKEVAANETTKIEDLQKKVLEAEESKQILIDTVSQLRKKLKEVGTQAETRIREASTRTPDRQTISPILVLICLVLCLLSFVSGKYLQ